MKNLKQLLVYVMVLSLGFCVACSGEDGADGLNGKDGIDGKDGSNGLDGKDGKDGNANVIASGWIANPFFGKSGSGASFPLNGSQNHINESSLNSSFVIVYGKNANSKTADALPIIKDRSTYYYFRITESNIRVGITGTVASKVMQYDNFSHFRYVVIPASTASTKVKKELQDMNYTQAMDFLNLEH